MSNNTDIRIVRADALVHVTNRTARGELLLTPSDAVNAIVFGCLASAAQKYGVQVVVFVVMGNHFHLVLRVPRNNLSEFMEWFTRESSMRLNSMRGTIGHRNFPDRYEPSELVREEDFEQLVGHILTNPVRAGLVETSADWPGLSSLAAHQSGDPVMVGHSVTRGHAKWIDEDDFDDVEERCVVAVLELAPPPFWDGLDPEEAQRRLAGIVERAEKELHEAARQRKRTGRRRGTRRRRKRPVGPAAILAEKFTYRPDRAILWREVGHITTSDPELAQAFEDYRQDTVRRYRRAARLWRGFGQWGDYPPGTFPPGWVRPLRASREGPPLPWWTPPLRAAA